MVKDNIFNFLLGHNYVLYKAIKITSFETRYAEIGANVRRYVALAQLRGGACFCTRGAESVYDVVLFVVALAKTVTPRGSPRREPGQAAPPTT
jgi:hypothetical protein